MRYIKIKAKDYNEAMMKLKMEHGEDAIPISHKYVKEGGIMNSKFFAKEVVEMTAAVKDKKPSPISSGANMGTAGGSSPRRRVDFTVDDSGGFDNPSGRNSQKKNDIDMTALGRTIDAINDNLMGLKSNRESVPPQPPVQTEQVRTTEQERSAERQTLADVPGRNFEKEFDELKDIIKRLANDKSAEKELNRSVEDNVLHPFVEMLRNNDFEADQSSQIINEVKDSMSREDLRDRFKIEKSLKELLKSRIVTTGPFRMGTRKKIMMFIGPTGVGKTTTMAKLGALHSLREGHKVVFITIDNYRIAATEQLKKYAEIMRIPIYAVNDQKEFRDLIAREKADIIMVDTSGRSHNNELKIAEIKSFADQVEYDFEKVLCISANTKKGDLNSIFKAFDIMHFNSIVITKTDETSFIGNVVDIADKYKKPIAYFTNGQEVPNDIMVASPDNLVDMMMGDTNK